MNVKEFPMCCGAYILTDFGNTTITAGTNEKIPPREVEDFLERMTERYDGAAFLMVILNKTQNNRLGEIFVDFGFELLSHGHNPNHRGGCFLYVRTNPVTRL